MHNGVRKSIKINAILNVIKQGCTIIFPLITFPYVSRILGADGFGKYNFSFSIADYFIILAALGISTYGVREGAKIRNDPEKINRFSCQVFTINCISTIISIISLLIVITLFPSLGKYKALILIIASQMALATIGADWINSIYEDYLYITLRYIFIQILALISIFVFVKNENDLLIYTIIMTLAASAGNIINIFYIRRYVKLKFVFNRELLIHIKPILILFVNLLAISVYVNADITMLGIYSNDEVVGIYSLASKIYNIVKRLINAIIIVAVPRLAFYSAHNIDNYQTLIKKTLNILILVLIPSVGGLAILSKPIMLVVGGEEYLPGADILVMLSLSLLFALFASVYSNGVLVIYNEEKVLLISTVISACLNIGLNIILLPILGMYGAALTTILAECLNMIIQGIRSRKYLSKEVLNKSDIVKVIIGTIIICAYSYIIINNVHRTLLKTFVAIIGSVLIYSIVMLLLKHSYVIVLVDNIKKRISNGSNNH